MTKGMSVSAARTFRFVGADNGPPAPPPGCCAVTRTESKNRRISNRIGVFLRLNVYPANRNRSPLAVTENSVGGFSLIRVGMPPSAHGRTSAENLFLRKQLALYAERGVRVRRADDCDP